MNASTNSASALLTPLSCAAALRNMSKGASDPGHRELGQGHGPQGPGGIAEASSGETLEKDEEHKDTIAALKLVMDERRWR